MTGLKRLNAEKSLTSVAWASSVSILEHSLDLGSNGVYEGGPRCNSLHQVRGAEMDSMDNKRPFTSSHLQTPA